MSTSAIVGILENNNDSQPNDLGKWLFRNINEKKQILSLLRKGDASSITSNSFFKNTESEIYQYQDFLNYISDDHPASYFYLFDVSKNLWIVSNFKNPKKFVPLEGIVLNTKSFEESRNINKVSRFKEYLEQTNPKAAKKGFENSKTVNKLIKFRLIADSAIDRLMETPNDRELVYQLRETLKSMVKLASELKS